MSTEENRLGCRHYNRNCALIAPCCKKQYICRVCHDEKEVNHELDRKTVSRVVCLKCQTEQDVQQFCEQKSCGTEFGKYFCKICRLYDNEDKRQFHCNACGLCRVGGQENFFHCDKCNLCLSLDIKDSHKCVENVSHDMCPVCLENLHTSRSALNVSPCGHILHRDCFSECLKKGLYACPSCNQSMVNMDETWKQVDEEVHNTDMPEEYRDLEVDIVCRDCHQESKTKFHVLVSSVSTVAPTTQPDRSAVFDVIRHLASESATGFVIKLKSRKAYLLSWAFLLHSLLSCI